MIEALASGSVDLDFLHGQLDTVYGNHAEHSSER